MNAFYALLKKWIGGKEYTSKIIIKEDYNARVNFLLRVKEGDIDCRKGYLTGNVNAYKWLKRYHVFKYGDDNAVLVLHPSPKKSGAGDVTAMLLNSLQQPTYAERLFIDLWKILQADHCKGVTFFYRVRDKHGNMTREVCKLFTDVCPHRIVVNCCRKPTAGIQPIITIGMCVRETGLSGPSCSLYNSSQRFVILVPSALFDRPALSLGGVVGGLIGFSTCFERTASFSASLLAFLISRFIIDVLLSSGGHFLLDCSGDRDTIASAFAASATAATWSLNDSGNSTVSSWLGSSAISQ